MVKKLYMKSYIKSDQTAVMATGDCHCSNTETNLTNAASLCYLAIFISCNRRKSGRPHINTIDVVDLWCNDGDSIHCALAIDGVI